MRVTTGKAKGRRLVAPPGLATRPITDRVKQAIFSSLGDSVRGAAVLDLYSGSGSLGIEALSRGASRAVFVDQARAAVAALRSNLAACGMEHQAEVHPQPVEEYLRTGDGRFDLVLLDPPWEVSSDEVTAILVMIDRMATKSCRAVLTRRWRDPEPLAPPGWRLATLRRHGDAKICWYEKESQ
jgi:16S rRNA (guanine966-N2)-methyltransferase